VLFRSPFFVGQGHTGKPHPYSAFWALAAVRWLFLASEEGTRRRYLLAGLGLGLAAGSNSSFACLAFLPLLVWSLRRREQPGGWRDALSAMAAAGGVYVLTNPYVFIATRDYLWETTVYPGGVRDFGGNLASLLGRWSWAGMGPGLYLLFAAGLLAALLRPDQRRRMLALCLACGFGVLWLFLAKFWGFLDSASLRFFMPFYALACLLAADCVGFLKRRWIKTVILTLVFCDCGLRSWVCLRNFQLDAGPRATREQAADWIEANIPAGAAVGLPRYPQPAHTPPFRYDRYDLVIFEKFEFLGKSGKRPEYLVTDAASHPGRGDMAMSGYELIRCFPSYSLGWAEVDAESFSNASFFIYRRR
jgi:4-amino-4-deoxy-L-arabinose transferase-like glycosyltransferase